MKKILIAVLITLFAVSAFSNLIDDVKAEFASQGRAVNELDMEFWESRAQFFDSYEQFNEQMTAYKFLKDEHLDRMWLTTQRMTSTDDMYMAAFMLIEPKAQTESSFYRLEPVRDQMFHGSCWSFANMGTFESSRAVQVLGKSEGNVDNDFDYAERWATFHNIDWDIYGGTAGYMYPFVIQDKSSLEGGNTYFSLYNSIRYGEMPEACAPYSEIGITDEEVIPLPPSAYAAERTHSTKATVIPGVKYSKALGYTYEEYINMIKTGIHDLGSLSISMSPCANFNAYTNGILTATGPCRGGHAMTVVGWAAVEDLNEIILSAKTNPDAEPVLSEATSTWTYTDYSFEDDPVEKTAQFCWIVKNSWGYSWGDGGYYVVPAISEAEYNDPTLIGGWQFESRDIKGAIFDSTSKHTTDDLDINADGTVNAADFTALTALLGTENPTVGDLAFPKDNKITNDDIATWIYVFNNK